MPGGTVGTLDIFASDNVITANRATAAALTDFASPLAEHPRVRHMRQRGMIWAADVDTADPGFGRRFYREALARGVLLRPLGHTLYIMLPYIATQNWLGRLHVPRRRWMRLLADGETVQAARPVASSGEAAAPTFAA